MKYKIFILFFLILPLLISVASGDETTDIINNSIVRIDLFWTVMKNGTCVPVEQSNSLGVLVSEDGDVLTCYHCVSPGKETADKYGLSSGQIADSITLVLLYNGKKKSFPAKVIDVDKRRDLALLKPYEKIKFNNPAKINTARSLNEQEIYYASVNPEDPWNSISSGKLVYPVLNDQGREVIGFQMHIKPGSSGSGMFDTSGNLIGLIYATGNLKKASSEEGPPLSLVIPEQFLALFLDRNDVTFLRTSP